MKQKVLRFFQYLGVPFSFLFYIGVWLRLFFFRSGICRATRVSKPVISVGNIVVGGTGKTTIVQYLATLLKLDYQARVAIISRGYQGKKSRQGGVVSDGQSIRLNAIDAGDEALLLAHQCPGCPVLIGQDRVKTAQYALSNFEVDVLLLDDAFSHLKIERDLDILVLNPEKPFDNGFLLPAGFLREPGKNIERADLIFLNSRNGRGPDKMPRGLEGRKHLIFSHYEACRLKEIPFDLTIPANQAKAVEKEWIRGKKVVLVSGIHQPADFVEQVKRLGPEIVDIISFPDHHFFTPKDIERILSRSPDILAIITTEKDGIRLSRDLIPPACPIPFLALTIELRIDQGESNLRFELSRILRLENASTRLTLKP